MNFRNLSLPGVYELVFEPRHDTRGYFERVYCEALFKQHSLNTHWVQENQSFTSRKHTIRGLHFQKPPFAETKFIRVISGAIYDVVVDLRRSSPTYGRWLSLEISAERQNAIYVPKGFAHGFCTLTDNVIVVYKVDCAYTPQAEAGIRWNDPVLAIPWPTTNPVLSERDRALPTFQTFETPFE